MSWVTLHHYIQQSQVVANSRAAVLCRWKVHQHSRRKRVKGHFEALIPPCITCFSYDESGARSDHVTRALNLEWNFLMITIIVNNIFGLPLNITIYGSIKSYLDNEPLK